MPMNTISPVDCLTLIYQQVFDEDKVEVRECFQKVQGFVYTIQYRFAAGVETRVNENRRTYSLSD